MLMVQDAAKQKMREMSGAEWILQNGPQRFHPTTTGMVHSNDAPYMLVADYEKVVAHFQAAALREIAGTAEVLTSETPSEQRARLQAIASRALGGAA